MIVVFTEHAVNVFFFYLNLNCVQFKLNIHIFHHVFFLVHSHWCRESCDCFFKPANQNLAASSLIGWNYGIL